MKQKGFSAILLIVALFFIAAISGVIYFKYSRQSVTSHRNEQPEEREEKLDVGDWRVKTDGHTTYMLPTGGEISGTNPYIVFSDYYLLNTVSKPNILNINKRLVTYHQSYKFDITNENCEIEHFFSDIPETRTSWCDLHIIISKEAPPTERLPEYKKEFLITENGPGIKGLQSLPGEPLLNLSTRSIRVQENVNHQIIEPPGGWNLYFVTNYGYEDIRFTPEELWNKQSKTFNMGPQQVTINIDDLSCKKLSSPEQDPCPYFTEVTFSVILTNPEDAAANPIRIQEFE